MLPTILVTGGAGYIGSHTVLELLESGYQVVVVDNLCNSKLEALNRVQTLTGKSIEFVEADVRNLEQMRSVFKRFTIHSVIHFAGLKAVGESVAKPVLYYDNNVHGSLALFQAMDEANVRNVVFSSSATVYGDPHKVPMKEDFPLFTTNPYAASKLMVENILRDIYKADNRWNIGILRYFNPAGAHESGLIGEDPNGIPNNLMPFIAQVATGKLPKLRVFGSDYPTIDGTGVRDYIHVVDLARGHLKAIEQFNQQCGLLTVNLGTGRGYSVLEMLKAFEKAVGRELPYEIVERRPGDVAVYYAETKLAKALLNWEAEKDQEAMCRDHWNWQSKNPNGYA